MSEALLQERKWNRDEYYSLAAHGYFDNERVELIHGRIVVMTPMGNEHAVAMGLVDQALRVVFQPGFWIRIQLPIRLNNFSEPEPDLVVVSGSPRDFKEHPTTALLVVEVSDTTLQTDRKIKAPLYAAANLPEYWILNLPDKQLEVHRDPQPDSNEPGQSRYGQVMTLTNSDAIAPLSAPGGQITISDLLP